MAVDRFIIIRNVHLEGKNALIVAKKVTTIRIAESQKNKWMGSKMKSPVNSTKTKSTEIKMNRKFVKVQMNNKEIKFQLDIGSDLILIDELERKLVDQLY